MKRIIYILIFGFILSSCDDFLTEEPVHKQTLENAVVDYDGAQNIINGMYASLTLGSGTSGSDFFGGSLACALSSQAGVSRAGGTTFYSMSYTSTTSGIATYWQQWYACVNAANAAIISISALADNKFPDTKEKSRMIAEARCFRAWVNAHLLWCFGHFQTDDEYGILYREELSDMVNVHRDRLSVKDSYQKIFDDLDAAIKDLGNYTTSKRLSRQLAQALKVKLLLNRGWEGDYANALSLLNETISTLPADFKMDPDMKNMYNEAWDSKEILWARYLEDGSGRAYSEFAYTQTIIQTGDLLVVGQEPSSLKTFYPEFNSWLETDPRYDVTMGWARRLNATGQQYFCPTKVARGGRADMNDKFTTYYFRYPELLLMQAELRARTGATIAEALAPINTLRNNRTNPVLPQIPEPATRNELMDIIFKEYCLELFVENGSEWFASLRFEKDGNPWFKTLKPDVSEVSTNKYCWPIPTVETNVNSQIKPNPGFDN